MVHHALLILLAVLLLSCRPPEPGEEGDTHTVTISLPEGPRLGVSPALVEIAENGAVVGADVRITGDMAHAGMVPVIRQAEESEPGRYLAQDFEFTMAGDWILTADVTLPDGSRLMRELRVTVPGRE